MMKREPTKDAILISIVEKIKIDSKPSPKQMKKKKNNKYLCASLQIICIFAGML